MDVNGNIITAKGLPDGFVRKDTKSVHGERLLALDTGTVAALKAHRDGASGSPRNRRSSSRLMATCSRAGSAAASRPARTQ